MKQYLLDKGIDYDYYEIDSSEELKEEFMNLRKQYEEYADIISGGTRFGIPALFYKDKVVISGDSEELDKFIQFYKEYL